MMRKLQILSFAILMSLKVFGQINMNDSTAQVIGFWNMNDKQTYVVSEEKYKVNGEDTTARELYKYKVDVTVVDSTANSYQVDWFYHDYDMQSDNPLVKMLSSMNKDLTVRIRTNEMGAFKEVVNWEETRDKIYEATKLLKEKTKDIPNMDAIFKQVEAQYSTKEAIEQGAIKEILQFYSFHGGRYELGEEYSGDIKVPNLYGGEPFDSHLRLKLDEINPENNNYIIRMEQSIDAEQLTQASFEQVNKMMAAMKQPPVKREDIPNMSNTTWTASRIHGSGWVIYSVETKKVEAQGTSQINERVISIE